MTRSISSSMAGVLEQLELDQPALVTSAELTRLLEAHGVRTPARIVAARLREEGWLLPTGRRSVCGCRFRHHVSRGVGRLTL